MRHYPTLDPAGGWLFNTEIKLPNYWQCQHLTDLPCDLPCAASLAGIQPVRPRAQRTSP